MQQIMARLMNCQTEAAVSQLEFILLSSVLSPLLFDHGCDQREVGNSQVLHVLVQFTVEFIYCLKQHKSPTFAHLF